MVYLPASRTHALLAAAVLLLTLRALAAPAGAPADPPVFLADLAITNLAVSPTPEVMVGGNVTYTIYFVNNGPAAAGNAFVKLPTPTDTTFASAVVTAGTGWSLTSPPAVGSTGDVIFTSAPGPASGAAAQFQVVVKVNASTHHYTTISATASTYTTDAYTIDETASNDSATAKTKAMIVADPLEPNDTPATASALPMGTTSGLIFSTDWNQTDLDNDWYTFCVAAGDGGKDLKVNVRITSTYPSSPPSSWRSDLDFTLYDSSVTLLSLALSGNDNETLYLHNIAASSCYYLNVPYATVDYAEGYGWGRYAITIETGTGYGIGYVTGRIMSSGGTPAPIAGVQISAYGVPWVQTTSYVTGTSGTDGFFVLPVLPGSHDLYFTGNLSTGVGAPGVNVVDEYYSDQTLLANATHITVTDGGTIDVGTVTMDVGAIVTGTVTDGSSWPLYYTFVYAYDLAGVLRASTYTDTIGNYTMMGVPVGGAKLRFVKSGFASEYYDDQPTFGTGTTLGTVSGATFSSVNAVMTSGGSISGTVTSVGGTGLSLPVVLYSVFDSTYRRTTVTSTAGTGAFGFAHVKPGSYKIYVDTTGTSFAPAWYGNASAFGGAAWVTVSEGGFASGNHIVLGSRGGGDFNGDLKSDILWRHATQGDVWLWPMDGTTRQSETFVRTIADTNWEIRAVADFNGDRSPDLMWRNKTTGDIYFWPMTGMTPTAETWVGRVDLAYDIVSAGDYTGDGKADLLWRNPANGELWVWGMNGATIVVNEYVTTVDPAYVIKASADMNGDGLCDIVWYNTNTGEVWVWLVRDEDAPIQVWVGTVPDLNYQIKAVADFGGDAKADILWHHAANGEVWIWTMNGGTKMAETWVGSVPDLHYEIVSTGDYNGDTKADILWWNSSDGEVWIWTMNGAAKVSETFVGIVPDTGYRIIK